MNPSIWEANCLTDEARNFFAIPIVKEYISMYSPCNIVDIGCGTGYISRCILESGVGQESKWLLIDYNSNVLNYARKTLINEHNIDFLELDIRLLVHAYLGKKNDFAFICYSLLEIAELEVFIKGVNNLLNQRAHVILIYPDVLEDVEIASMDSLNIYTQYRMGASCIVKLNSSTGERLNFFAHRIENIIQKFCEINFYLSDFRSYSTIQKKQHFALIFRRE